MKMKIKPGWSRPARPRLEAYETKLLKFATTRSVPFGAGKFGIVAPC